MGVDPPALRNFWRADKHRPAVRPGRIRRTRHVWLSRDEVARVLWRSRGTPQAAWIATGVYAGLRRRELVHLRTDVDVDLEADEIHVQPRDGRHKWAPKSDLGVRDVPMNPRLARWLRAHVRGGYAGNRYFFRLPDRDQPFSDSVATRWTRIAFEAAGVKYGRRGDAATTHTLRHTFGTWLARAEVPVPDIAHLMGEKMETVLSTYLHHFPADRRKAVERLTRRVR
jgi:integrase